MASFRAGYPLSFRITLYCRSIDRAPEIAEKKQEGHYAPLACLWLIHFLDLLLYCDGCGCGFAYGRYPDHEKPEETTACTDSVARLAGYLRDIVSRVGIVELFACWEGQQADAPTRRRTVTPAEIGGSAFWFEDREFLSVTP